MNYYLAVDGGGTKTDYALVDEQGEIVDVYRGERTNHETFSDGYEGMYFSLYEAIYAMLLRNNVRMKQIKDAVLGLAGADHDYQKQQIALRLQKIGLQNFFICNDGFLPIKSEVASGVGIAYNCGTGVCCGAINSQGQMLQLGGLGWHSGDYGGGSVIVEKTFTAMYNELFLHQPKTAISELYCQEFQLGSPKEIYDSIRLLYEDPQYSTRTVSVFFKAVNANDEVAMKIARAMARRGALYISSAYRNLNFSGKTEVVLTGSIHTKADSGRYIEMLHAEVEKCIPGAATFKIATRDPVQGAVKWLAERNSLKSRQGKKMA